MSCDLTHEDLIAYVHGEVEPARKGAIAAHLEQCAACRGQYEELQQTRRLLAAWPDEEPASKVVFLPRQRAGWGRWRRLGWGVSLAAAASLAILALGRTQIEYGQGQVRLQWSFGAAPAPDSAAAPLTRAEFEQGQRQLAELVQQAVRQAQDQQRQDLEKALLALQGQQRRQLEQALTSFALELDKQRQEDLRAVSQGLQVMDWSTADRFTRTEGLLQQLLIAAIDR
jgi:anti-sigma factor RsiW